ncbi:MULTISPECIES: type II toxin-antitoxin system VapC family toxin [unclassified Frankia]|uniref:type II toxin-antitoxin system VapC family toxin n=1 Tax=unclassified Frankia TaxID=2632575 RepID=UPI0020243379
MILPDVNVLVYAYRREAQNHATYASWLTATVGGRDELALTDHCLTGFLRIVTNPRILADPAPTADALRFVNRLRTAPRGRPLTATPATWDVLGTHVSQDQGIRGNLVPDAYLAALAISHGCRLATTDRGFARFPGLDFFDPATTHR